MYTVDYFIEKFKAIPSDEWTIEYLNDKGKCCAMGHCGVTYDDLDESREHLVLEFHNEEAEALCELLQPLTKYSNRYEAVWNINDGHIEPYSVEENPKARILAALYDIKKLQQPEYKNISKELAILPVEETADKQVLTPQL